VNEQLGRWEGDFGRAYTDRNVLDWRLTRAAFDAVLGGLGVRSVLEVGCNRGHNLATVHDILGPESDVVGVEPNRYALEFARRVSPAVSAIRGRVQDLPFKDGSFELVFTVGVLIHIDPEELGNAMREIGRVASRYVLAAEYAAETLTVVPYRGFDDMLWKADFGALYRQHVPELNLVGRGEWGPADGFDNVTWWLLERRP
jgi:pseudaminic acid biosynthesis-associated methylase